MSGELENETTSKIETHGCVKQKIMVNHVCLGEVRWDKSRVLHKLCEIWLMFYVRHCMCILYGE